MNKILHTLLLSALVTLTAHAQSLTLVSSKKTDSATGLEFDGDALYFTSHYRDIYKLNTAEVPPIGETLIYTHPTSITFNDQVLYGGELYIVVASENTLYKLDPEVASPPLETVIGTGVSTGPTDLALDGDVLYIANHDADKITKVNLAASPLSIEDVLTTDLDGPSSLAIYNGALYIEEDYNQRISKISLTGAPNRETVLSNINVASLAFYGADLYVADNDTYEIFKITVTDPDPPSTKTNVVTGLIASDLFSMAFKGSTLYFEGRVDYNTGRRIYRTDVGTLGSNTAQQPQLVLYPNPASHSISLTNLTQTSAYRIHNILGATVHTGQVSNNEQIDISGLGTGLYFIKLKGSPTALKFVKE